MEGDRKTKNSTVVVVGGGPAGSSAAIFCALRGLSVTLMECATFPRSKPGESLHPGVETLFQTLGIWSDIESAGFLRFEGIWRQSATGRRFAPFGGDAVTPWRGYHAPRQVLDALLLKRAELLGVRIIQPCARDVDPITEKGNVKGVKVGQEIFSADHVIDATGGRNFLISKLSLPVHRGSPRLTARYAYFSSERTSPEPHFLCYNSGWDWIAMVAPKILAWCGIDLNGGKRPIPTGLLALPRISAVRGADVSWRCVKRCAGPGYFLVGDAACVLDPAASHGVLKALMSGIFAAHLICNVSDNQSNSECIYDLYSDWIYDWFNRDVERLRSYYTEIPDAPDWVRNRTAMLRREVIV